MNETVAVARGKLLEGAYTCVVLMDGAEYLFHERGVKPLLSLLETGRSFVGAVAADKTVGAGAAHLYVLLGVSAVWANVISESAMAILEKNEIAVSFGDRVPHIINRQGNGVCPIELAVANAKSSQDAYALIIDALERLGAHAVGKKQ